MSYIISEKSYTTLNAALDSVGLLDKVGMINMSVGYGQTLKLAHNGLYVSVHRYDNGNYEEPVYYKTQMDDFIRVV